ncbi:hypothetical protein Goklo_008564, partial [Gossypium klotzschianum]|nr:hypothetical protein [Gossypium klotzschianum]
MLEKIQQNLFDVAKQKRDACIEVVKTWDEFVKALGQKKLILAPWCDEEEVEKDVKARTKGEMGAAKSLCTPFEQPELPEVKAREAGELGSDKPHICEESKLPLVAIVVLNALLLGSLQQSGPIGAEVTRFIHFLKPSPFHGSLPDVNGS